MQSGKEREAGNIWAENVRWSSIDKAVWMIGPKKVGPQYRALGGTTLGT